MTLTGTALASSPANVDAKRIESIANGGEAGNWPLMVAAMTKSVTPR
ncbi:MAG: hypothetical protein RBT39_03715 [Azoarcus sp.]|nr:hypothetical protein [Azoarcus sp.]